MSVKHLDVHYTGPVSAALLSHLAYISTRKLYK